MALYHSSGKRRLGAIFTLFILIQLMTENFCDGIVCFKSLDSVQEVGMKEFAGFYPVACEVQFSTPGFLLAKGFKDIDISFKPTARPALGVHVLNIPSD
jgi:hypothetical protein